MDDQSIFDIYPNWHSDTRIGPLNVADDEKPGDDVLVIPDSVELKLAEQEALVKTGGAVATGVVGGTLGLPGEIESLARGGIENLKQKNATFMQTMAQLADTLGMDQMSNLLTDMYGEDKRGGIEAFLEGLDQDTFFPKMEEVEQKIIASGIELPDGDMEGLRDGLMILGELFSGEQILMRGKDVAKKVGKKLRKGKAK